MRVTGGGGQEMNYLQRQAKLTGTPPQTEPLNERQVQNSAGGFAFPVDDWTRLERFLVLGSEGGSYYATEQKLTAENAKSVITAIRNDGQRVVRTVVDISQSGRAPKNSPAIFVLALCSGLGDTATKQGAMDALPKVCRTGTHLFEFLEYVQAIRGWGRSLRRGVGEWYLSHSPERLAALVTKYRQRNGWTHRDALRLSHPKDTKLQPVFEFATKGVVGETAPKIIHGYVAAQEPGANLVDLIEKYNLTWEMLPTGALKKPEIWEALLPHMGITALLRNLATMTRLGLVAPLSGAAKFVCEELTNQERLNQGRVHPMSVLFALTTYGSGKGFRGSNTWTPVAQVTDALNEAFYKAFANVEPTHKRWYLACDISGSMSSCIMNSNLSARDASAAMALVTARTEPEYVIRGFANGGTGSWRLRGENSVMAPLHITAQTQLRDAIREMQRMDFGGTDCSLPMTDALANKIPVDVFVVYTDSETWAGRMHPMQSLQEYRNKMGIPAKLIVVGMVSNEFTIADPADGGCMDVVGFDAAAPRVMSDFVRAG